MYCKSSIPEYYAMNDLNEDTGSSWPLYFDNKERNGHLYNGYMLNYLNGYSEYDKEMLKRTMLEHEAIFKRQVYELHRLYRIQKNLMEDFQKNDLYRFSTWPIEPKATFSLSGVQSQVTRKMWQISHQAAMSSSMSRETVAETDMNISPISFCESNPQSNFGQLENGPAEKDGESNPRFRVHMKRMFDLRLPADVYIDCDGTEKSEEDFAGSSSVTRVPCSKNRNADPENKVKLTLAKVDSPNGGVCKSNSQGKGSLVHGLADLNEPIKETSSEGTLHTVPARLLFQGTQSDEYQKHNGSCTSNKLWLQSSFSRDRDCDERGYSNNLLVKEEINQVWPQPQCEAGKYCSDWSPEYGKENFPLSFEAIQLKVDKINDILLTDCNKADAKFMQKQITYWKILGNSSYHAVSDNPEKLASVLPNSSIASELDNNATASPQLPTRMKPLGGEKHSSVPLETTSMNKFRWLDTTSKDSSTSYDTLHFTGNLRSHHHHETAPFSYRSGVNRVFHLDSWSVSHVKPSFTNSGLSLRESSPGIQDHIIARESKASGMDGDCKGYSSGLPWLKNQPSCSEALDMKRTPSKVDLCFIASGLGNETELEIRTSIPSCNLEAFPSSLHASEDKTKKIEIADSSSKKCTFGLPIFDKVHPNAGSKNQRQVASPQHGSSFCDVRPLNTERGSSAERGSFRNNIDLNCEVQVLDEPVFSQLYAESQDRVSSQILDSSSVSKALPFIDLEAPVLNPEEDNITQTESTLCSKRDVMQQNGCTHDMLFEEAAKNLMELSLDKFNISDDNPSCLLTTLSCSTLHWFADVVLSNTDGKIPGQDDEVDLFEQMTLQLQEMKPEELWCNPRAVEAASNDAKSRAFLLLKKPRRGQARKRRQRRDFQKDTLPGLATLSRQEVNEDLQTIGGMMKASGCPWELGMGRRNTGRNGIKAHAKGRRQPLNTAVIATEVQNSPPPTLFLDNKNPNNPEVEVDKPGMVGWGRTTRRCRRLRCPPPNITTALT